jgi:polysaccharide biosynthesis acetyltransferase WcbI-like protein
MIPATGLQLLERMDKTERAQVENGGAVRIRQDQPPDCFLYGPYIRLDGGSYCLRFDCRSGMPRRPAEPVLGVEILAQNRVHLLWRDFTAAELRGGAMMDFQVGKGLALDQGVDAPLEFKFYHLGKAELCIAGIELLRTSADAVAPDSSLWRIHGLFNPGWAASRGPQGIRVRRLAPPGVFASYRTPHLCLAAGRYRLDLQVEAAKPGRPEDAVLGLNLGFDNTGHRLAREFKRQELREGLVHFAFEVPSELGQEAGVHAPFLVQLHHFGKSGLLVRDIVLRRLPGGGPAPGAEHLGPRPAKARAKVVVVGNCHADIVYEGFRHGATLNGRFEVRKHYVYMAPNLHEHGKRDLADCDIVLVQDIDQWEDYPLREYVPDSARIVKFPCLRFASAWPFDSCNGSRDIKAEVQDSPNYNFTYFDGLLGRLRQEIPEPEQRFAAYRSLAVERLLNYRRMHQIESFRLRKLDQNFDCRIGEYILENFQQRQVFYTTNHPNGTLFTMLMQQICRSLGLSETFPELAALDQLHRLQVPVHPLVAAGLGIRWADEATRYRYRGEEITWETFVRRYIAYFG